MSITIKIADRFRIRPVTKGDCPQIMRWKQDPLIQRMALGSDSTIKYNDQLSDIERSVQATDHDYLILELLPDDIPIGYIRLDWLDSEHRCAWLRFALGSHRGHGCMRDCLSALLQKLFQGGMHRIEAEVYSFNQASRHLLERLGFQREGCKRNAQWDGQQYWNILCYGLLSSDHADYSVSTGV